MQLLKSRRRHQRQQRQQLQQQHRQQRQRQHRRRLQDTCKAKKVAQSRRRFRSLLLLLRSECGNRCRSKRYARTHLCMYASTTLSLSHTHTHTHIYSQAHALTAVVWRDRYSPNLMTKLMKRSESSIVQRFIFVIFYCMSIKTLFAKTLFCCFWLICLLSLFCFKHQFWIYWKSEMLHLYKVPVWGQITDWIEEEEKNSTLTNCWELNHNP